MDVKAFLNEIKSSPNYADQIVFTRDEPPRPAVFGAPRKPIIEPLRRMLGSMGIDNLYAHQALALDILSQGSNILMTTGPASGKSLCYILPALEMLIEDPASTVLMLFPSKALCQDQFGRFQRYLEQLKRKDITAGVYDGDTPMDMRRKLRDNGRVIFTNPDMLHAGIMPKHTSWEPFLANLRFIVIDELHTYGGIYGSNIANLFRRLDRLLTNYGSAPQFAACSATVANPGELAEELTGRSFTVINQDSSPRGRHTTVFWNPPLLPHTVPGSYRPRRSANADAHRLMTDLIKRGIRTITFSKAKTTAELIHRYTVEALSKEAPQLVSKVAPYRGGYLPEERREIERKLFNGEILGISATRALELGIDIGGLDAAIIVGYPGLISAFLQQAGRAGRRSSDSLVILIGLDTPANQYVLSHPEYVFDRPVEKITIDKNNPFVTMGHLRCAANEMPLNDNEIRSFGPCAEMALDVLKANGKLTHTKSRWYHSTAEIPQHEIAMRSYSNANVTIQDVDSNETIGQVDKFEASPLLHPEAIYMHRGETYRVLSLDLEKKLARVTKEDVDYYTQPLGGTGIDHIDHQVIRKKLGTGYAYWGEVTSKFQNFGYEQIRFYELDAIARHFIEMPYLVLETMAFWVIPPEELVERVRLSGLNVFGGLRGIGYATRMMLPIFITCDTLDLSHSVGCLNSPWQAIFVYERYPLGVGITRRAYDDLPKILRAVRDHISECPCDDGCPCCVGKPLRQSTVWNVERGEGAIPSKSASLAILNGLLEESEGIEPRNSELMIEDNIVDPSFPGYEDLRRRLERMGEPQVLHEINPEIVTEAPKPTDPINLTIPDSQLRSERRRVFDRELRRRTGRTKPVSELTNLPKEPLRQSEIAADISDIAAQDGQTIPDQTDSACPPQTKPAPSGDSIASKAWRKKRGIT